MKEYRTQKILCGGPMVLFKYKHLTCKRLPFQNKIRRAWLKIDAVELDRNITFCQFFFKRETRKLMLIWTFWKSCFSSMERLPTATPIHRTFFNWNFTVAFVSFTFPSKDSWWLTRVGNFPVCQKPFQEQFRTRLIQTPKQRDFKLSKETHQLC